MTSTGVVRQQASNSVLQRGKGRAGEGGLDRSVVQTDLLLEPEEHQDDKSMLSTNSALWFKFTLC